MKKTKKEKIRSKIETNKWSLSYWLLKLFYKPCCKKGGK